MTQIRGKVVVVTGGAGFIGSNLCEALLEQDNEVRCLDNFATGHRQNIQKFLPHPNFVFQEGDIRKPEDCDKAVAGADLVLHQAAIGSVPRSIKDPLTTNGVNITGFLNVLEACRKAGISRLVYAASSSTYGDSPQLPKVEDTIGKPLSPYAITKYVNELYASVYSDLYGLESIGLRYFNVFGKKQDPQGAYAAVIPQFISRFLAHQSPVINGSGTQTRDFTYISNVIQAVNLAATTSDPNAVNQVYNVACGRNYSLTELAETLRSLLAEKDPEIAGIALSYGPARVGDIHDSLASIEKIQRLLHYHPTHDLQQGLRETVGWYKS